MRHDGVYRDAVADIQHEYFAEQVGQSRRQPLIAQFGYIDLVHGRDLLLQVAEGEGGSPHSHLV